MLKIKLYKYSSTREVNGYRGTDYSDLVLQGFQDTEDITQEMDTSEITICGLDRQEEFDPETKFIIDIVDVNELGEEILKTTLHRVVARDTVEQPILSDDHYFNHHISLIEPSVIAQKRLVDNISATYKLKDVNLNVVPAYPSTLITYGIEDSHQEPTRNFQVSQNIGFLRTNYSIDFGKYFELEGDLQITNASGIVTDIYNNIERFKNQDDTYTANFTIPKMAIYVGQNGTKTFSKIGYASLHYKIEEYDVNDENNPTIIAEDNIISNDNLGAGVGLSGEAWQSIINGEWLYERQIVNITNTNYNYGYPNYYYKKYTDRSASTPNYTISDVPIQKDKRYVLTVSLYQFTDNMPSRPYPSRQLKYTGSQPTRYCSIDANYQNTTELTQTITRDLVNVMTSSNTTATCQMITYDITSSKTIVYASSIPYSALALLQKAILNSSVYDKREGSGVYIADVNKSNLPFVIDSDYIDTLSATRVIENFYNQKNLWELMIEVGHYIHAIPELKFGANDKFVITFNELGRTDQKEDVATKINIYNSRSVEDYISATSSYVANMVQLGGYIEEWVAPKTSDETLLISNDTANILTTKPIIELLNIKVRANKNLTLGSLQINAGDIADITDYIYEQNVYNVLGLEYDTVPNRGIAMYYKLGTNQITGGNYQLPQANTNIYTDYAFKKIIWCAFYGEYPIRTPIPTTGYWLDLKVNDFSFLIKYRTKDEVRQNHVRPDLRKYLVSSKHDRFPEHNQFNNQQDVLVDSIKFGNNVYGKLIKTGNSEYTKQEWVDNYDNVKHKGELYNINGSLYYVANVTNYYYATHIISDVKFSKDYNELSAVIGIPSEPRFYEISEQSSIQRDFAMNELLLLTDDDSSSIDTYPVGYVYDAEHLKNLIFGVGTGTFAKYALTVFKGDKDSGTYDQTVGQPYFYKEILTPINAYSSENTLTYEWDMIDNYSAGDKVIPTPHQGSSIDNTYYNSLEAVRYTDIYGKSPLMDFYVLGDIPTLTTDEIKALPESPIQTIGKYIGEMQVTALPTEQELNDFVSSPQIGDIVKVVLTSGNDTTYYKYTYLLNDYDELEWQSEEIQDTWIAPTGHFLGESAYAQKIYATNTFWYDTDYNGRGLGLLKDNRETISCNYNLQLITSSDTFVLSPFLFLPDKKNCCIALMGEETNKLSNGYLDTSKVITAKDLNDNDMLDSNGMPYFHWGSATLSLYQLMERENGWNKDLTATSAFRLRLDSILTNVNPHHFDGTEGYQQVKSIAIICNVNQNPSEDTSGVSTIAGKTQFVIARNIPSTWSKADAIKRWTFGSPRKSYFANKQ